MQRHSHARQRLNAPSLPETLEARRLLAGSIVLHTDPSTARELTTLGALAYFVAEDRSGTAIYRTDGTAAGTSVVKHFGDLPYRGFVGGLTRVGDRLFFCGYDPAHGNELWSSDGTAAGTTMVKDINAGAASSLNFVWGGQRLAADSQGTLYLEANGTPRGSELWKSDGTPAGTVKVTNIAWIEAPHLRNFTTVGNTLYFASEEELWKSDGSAAGTSVVRPAEPGAPGTDPQSLTASNGMLFFDAAGAGGNRRQLWRTDGTAAGTVAITGDLPNCYRLTDGGDRLFFFAGQSLFVSDGTTAGTVELADLGVQMNNFGPMAVARGVAYAVADQGNSSQVWKSDGTPAGTAPLTVLTQEVTDHAFAVAAGDAVFFVNAGRVWGSDGTAAGTTLLPATTPWDPSFAAIGGTFCFAGFDPEHGHELWKTDRTAGGTGIVKDINVRIGLASVTGSDSADAIAAATLPDGTVTVTLNGTSRSFAPEGAVWVYVESFDGDDAIDLSGLGLNANVFAGGGHDSIRGGSGDDSLRGDDGDDTVTGGAGHDYLSGGNGEDSLAGDDGIDSLWGEAGRDTLRGNAGRDYLHGGDDADLISGNGGHDLIWGEAGPDHLHGGPGLDHLYGGPAADRLWGEAGDDWLLNGGPGNDRLDGGAGDDLLWGWSGDDDLACGGGRDSLCGGSGNDVLHALDGTADLLDGGKGSDSAEFDVDALDGLVSVEEVLGR